MEAWSRMEAGYHSACVPCGAVRWPSRASGDGSMRVLLIGVGTVGEAIARLTAERDWCTRMVLADVDHVRAAEIAGAIGQPERFVPAAIDAGDSRRVADLARLHHVDLVLNAVDPRFVMPIFEGCLAADIDYMDMATSLSRPHHDRPFEVPGVKLGD